MCCELDSLKLSALNCPSDIDSTQKNILIASMVSCCCRLKVKIPHMDNSFDVSFLNIFLVIFYNTICYPISIDTANNAPTNDKIPRAAILSTYVFTIFIILLTRVVLA